jgi:hypothetical protein
MRRLRTILIVLLVLAGLFVAADRVAVHFAQGEVADRLQARENLAETPDVSIDGFPFLTQLASGSLDDVHIGIPHYSAAAAGTAGTIRVDDLKADMKDVAFSGDYSSATAASATGTATIAYDQLLKAAKTAPAQIAPGVTARIVGLSDGGNGKIKVSVEATVFGTKLAGPIDVLSSVDVKGGRMQVQADTLPKFGDVSIDESRIRALTDFQQAVDRLPGGVKLDQVRAAKNGVEITVKGTDVQLAG